MTQEAHLWENMLRTREARLSWRSRKARMMVDTALRDIWILGGRHKICRNSCCYVLPPTRHGTFLSVFFWPTKGGPKWNVCFPNFIDRPGIDLFMGRKFRVPASLVKIPILERRYDKSSVVSIQFLQHGRVQRFSDKATKICTGVEIDIQHHDIVRSSKEPSDIPPVVELTIVGVDDEMYVSVGHQVFWGSDHVVQQVENRVDVWFDVLDVDRDWNWSWRDLMNGGGSNGERTFVLLSQPGKDLEPVARNERCDRDIVSSERACRAIKVRDHVGRTHGTRKRLGEDC